MSREALSALLLSASTPSKLAIVDVRDSGNHPRSLHLQTERVLIDGNRPYRRSHPLLDLGS